MATDKRARKREARAAREELMRQRRNRRLIAVGVVVVAVVGMAIFASRDQGGNQQEEPEPQAEATEQAEGAACDAEVPAEANPQQYNRPPEMQLEDGVDYGAVIHTSCGDITIDLLEDDAPLTVNNFVFLAREGFYDGLTWHRIVSNFVIQGGDPQGTGQGGPGYEFEDELPKKAKVYTYGAVAMANSGPNTNGSQFFIVTSEPKGKPAGLQPLYSYFGVADEASFETIDAIAKQETFGGNDPAQADMPVTPVYIDSIEITEQ